MTITIKWSMQLKKAAGCSEETFNIPENRSVAEAVRAAAAKHDTTLKAILLDESNDLQKSILTFVNDEQLFDAQEQTLRDGDILTLMAPIAGG